jgi:hypothetical protein
MVIVVEPIDNAQIGKGTLGCVLRPETAADPAFEDAAQPLQGGFGHLAVFIRDDGRVPCKRKHQSDLGPHHSP